MKFDGPGGAQSCCHSIQDGTKIALAPVFILVNVAINHSLSFILFHQLKVTFHCLKKNKIKLNKTGNRFILFIMVKFCNFLELLWKKNTNINFFGGIINSPQNNCLINSFLRKDFSEIENKIENWNYG